MSFYTENKQLVDQVAHAIAGAVVVAILMNWTTFPIAFAVMMWVALWREIVQHWNKVWAFLDIGKHAVDYEGKWPLGVGSMVDLAFFALGGFVPLFI